MKKKAYKPRAIDLFCGAGGSSWGARLAGVQIVAGFDRWKLATDVYKDNFPEAMTFFGHDLEDLDIGGVQRTLGDIDLILASPECTNHSPAKGKGRRCERSRETTFQVTRFADLMRPRWIVIENVVSMRRWHRYPEFIDSIRNLGYEISVQTLDSSEFLVPQKRRRLFILCDLEGKPAQITPAAREPVPASSFILSNGEFPYSPLRTQKRAVATIERADRAISEIGERKHFLLVYYGSDKSGGWQRCDRPLRTITTLDRFAHVKPSTSGHMMRMLQVPELKAAMGMPKKFAIVRGTRRERVKMVGNAVCPPVMRTAVKALLDEKK